MLPNGNGETLSTKTKNNDAKERMPSNDEILEHLIGNGMIDRNDIARKILDLDLGGIISFAFRYPFPV